jgi:hypothetical protein
MGLGKIAGMVYTEEAKIAKGLLFAGDFFVVLAILA